MLLPIIEYGDIFLMSASAANQKRFDSKRVKVCKFERGRRFGMMSMSIFKLEVFTFC